YHAMSFGWIVGEIIHRVTGKPLPQVLEEEIAKPLGVSGELYYSVPDSVMDRVAHLVEIPPEEPPAFELPADHPIFKIAPPSVQPSVELYNSRTFLKADVPAGGTMSARAIARMYAALLGPVDGVRFVSPERLELIRTVVDDDDVDQVMQFPTPKTLGYFNGRFDPEPASPPTEFGYGGMIGTHADADPETGTSFALMKTRYDSGDFSAAATLTDIVSKTLAK
ncbi:beta-lactamase family protein, partial [Saccharothrix sp. MB29]|nr:beta-lactamase family protein [Saccharothrix sp. MB29]